jgi:hypothetical protein
MNDKWFSPVMKNPLYPLLKKRISKTPPLFKGDLGGFWFSRENLQLSITGH